MNPITQMFIRDLIRHIDAIMYANNPEYIYTFNDVKVTIKMEKLNDQNSNMGY